MISLAPTAKLVFRVKERMNMLEPDQPGWLLEVDIGNALLFNLTLGSGDYWTVVPPAMHSDTISRK
jgi:hypothetical protein